MISSRQRQGSYIIILLSFICFLRIIKEHHEMLLLPDYLVTEIRQDLLGYCNMHEGKVKLNRRNAGKKKKQPTHILFLL